MSSNIIAFYDLSSRLPNPNQACSPTTWKTRYCLNFKGLAFQTIPVDYPDIEATCKRLGAAPTSKNADGSPIYTLPIIQDPSTGATITDTLRIAQYLDATYPDTPIVVPIGTAALHLAFVAALTANLSALWQFAVPATNNVMNAASEASFRAAMEMMFGRKLEDVVPSGEDREVQWQKVKEGFGVVHRWLEAGKGDGPFVMGRETSYADFEIASHLIGVRILFGETSEEWKVIEGWHDGRWGALVKSFRKYEGNRETGEEARYT